MSHSDPVHPHASPTTFRAVTHRLQHRPLSQNLLLSKPHSLLQSSRHFNLSVPDPKVQSTPRLPLPPQTNSFSAFSHRNTAVSSTELPTTEPHKSPQQCSLPSLVGLDPLQFSSVQFSRSVVSDSLPPHESQHARPPCPSPTPRVYSNSCPSSQWCHPVISSSVFPFSSCPQPLQGFSNESTLHMRWPKYWSFSFSISPSNEHPGLTSFRMDWLDLLAVQGTLKSLLQYHSSKASIFQHSAFFTVQFTSIRDHWKNHSLY